MDIPSFLKPDFAAGHWQCCCSHSMCTRVWVIKSILFHAPTLEIAPGEKAAHKRLNQTNPRLNPTAAAAATFPACRWWRR